MADNDKPVQSPKPAPPPPPSTGKPQEGTAVYKSGGGESGNATKIEKGG